ncbi:hypothetical protein BJV82DRAFT_666117 [Fennellomyces sp. T-0311]|nr:hypothetical protein BJV82DRAFT_666117 [Fennellomyces sp. T-0311]
MKRVFWAVCLFTLCVLVANVSAAPVEPSEQQSADISAQPKPADDASASGQPDLQATVGNSKATSAAAFQGALLELRKAIDGVLATT